MLPRRFFGPLVGLCLAILVPGACSSGDDSDGAGLGDACASNACAAGLYCATGGPVPGLCTADCTGFGNCEPHFGDNSVCSGSGGGVCLKLCTADEDCHGALCTPLPGLPGKSYCHL